MTYDRRYQKMWHLDRAHGITRCVPAGPTREHVASLMRRHSGRAVAQAAGVSPSVVSELSRGRINQLRRATAAALLAVTDERIMASRCGDDFVPNLGSRRRIQALLAIGWRHLDITAAMLDVDGRVGTHSSMVLHQRGQWVARRTHDVVAAVFERLWDRPGPSSRTRDRARALHYLPPMAWAGLDIDDPRADPAAAVEDGIDDIAVERAMRGEQVHLTRAERADTFRRLVAAGLTHSAAADRLHMSGQRARQLLQEAS